MITAVVFTTLEPVSKLIAGDVNPYTITLWRFLIGSVMLLPFAIRKIKKENLKIELKDIGILTLLGTFCICFSMVMLQVAVQKADVPSLIAIILCTIGVIVCADFSSRSNLASVALAVVAALSFSLYTILSKKFMKKLSGVIQTSFSFLTGSIVLLVVLLVMKEDMIPDMTVKNISVLIYLVIVFMDKLNKR